jgi:hypothetical protein
MFSPVLAIVGGHTASVARVEPRPIELCHAYGAVFSDGKTRPRDAMTANNFGSNFSPYKVCESSSPDSLNRQVTEPRATPLTFAYSSPVWVLVSTIGSITCPPFPCLHIHRIRTMVRHIPGKLRIRIRCIVCNSLLARAYLDPFSHGTT